MKSYAFRRIGGDQIEMTGTVLAGRVTVLGMAGEFEVWRVAPGHVYSGQGRPWNRTPSRLLLVRVSGLQAHVQDECKPGTRWASKRREFLDEMNDRGGGREGLLVFKREG